MARMYYERTKLEESLGVSSDARQIKLFRLPNTYVAMDLETTGLDVEEDGILEIGAVKVVDGIVSDEFHTMVNTEARMKPAARKVNGITRPMLKGAPKTPDAIAQLLEFVGDLPMLGHNAKKFDKLFVDSAAMQFHGLVVENEWIDTMEIAKRVFGRNMSLKNMCELLGVSNEQAHRALSDVKATNDCYQKMRDVISKVSIDPKDLPDPNPDGSLHGELICFTGNPYDPSKREIMEKTLEYGGALSNGMNKKVTILVNLGDAGDEETSKIKRAKELADETGVRILESAEFLPLIGIEAASTSDTIQYTPAVEYKPTAAYTSETIEPITQNETPDVKPKGCAASFGVIALTIIAGLFAISLLFNLFKGNWGNVIFCIVAIGLSLFGISKIPTENKGA